ncbi:MAG: inositol monophosphatase family protein [Thermodesulfobacteriota bacterium]
MQTEENRGALLAFITELITNAGRVLMSFHEGTFRVHLKNTAGSNTDIVTDADRASEDLILESIRKTFPSHDILTEERLTDRTGSRWLWIIDPLDGTVNFAHGYPMFSVSIAVMKDDELQAGAVFDPLRKDLFAASRGGGAFLNGAPIRVSGASQLERCILGTGFPYDKATSKVNNLAEFREVLMKVQGMRRAGSAALDLAYVASGRLDGFWELKLKPWDMAAGMLLVREAGGMITDRRGNPTDIFTQSIVATNGAIHDKLVSALTAAE